MIKDTKTIILFCLIAIFIGCGGSKEELVLENETPESLLQKSYQAFETGNYDQSITLAQTLLDYFPTSDLHIDAQLQMAKVYGTKEEYENQFDLLLRVLKENIIPEKVPLIYSQIADFYETSASWNPGTVSTDSVDFLKAAEFYKKAVFYPNSQDNSTKARALYRMGLMYAKVNQTGIASKAYQELISTYPTSPYAIMARTKLADPGNTSELPVPTVEQAGTVAQQPPASVEKEAAATTETKPAAVSEEPAKIELPAEESEQPSIIDSLKTIDKDSPGPEEE
jgi:tetratricopeptide (TPR) repeat protein